MKLFRNVVVFIIIGFIISTVLLLFSGDSSTLGPSFSSLSSENTQGISICPDVIIESTGYLRGWPYGVAEISIYASSDDFTIASCQGEQDDVYPISYLTNTVIFASISYLVYVLGKRFKKKGIKNG